MVTMVAVAEEHGPGAKVRSARDRIEARRETLRKLEIGGQLTSVTANLEAEWAAGLKPDRIRIRNGFSRLATALAADYYSDRRVPKAALRPPATALHQPKGMALKLYLCGLFEAQCHARADQRRINNRPLGFHPSVGKAAGTPWMSLLAVAADHTPGKTSHVLVPDNRHRQVRAALDLLERHRLVALPNKTVRGRKYENFRLLEESATDETEYTVPGDRDWVFTISSWLWRSGWLFALTDSELALLLMLESYRESAVAWPEDGFLFVAGRPRVTEYCLGPDAYRSYRMLEDVGLLEVQRDARSREQQTVLDDSFATLDAHKFRLDEAGFERYPVPLLKQALQDRLDWLP